MPTIGTLPYPLGFTPPTSAQANLVLRPGWHSLCTHLGHFPDMCVAESSYTLYKASSLRTCRLAVILSGSEESAKKSGLNFTHRCVKIKHRNYFFESASTNC